MTVPMSHQSPANTEEMRTPVLLEQHSRWSAANARLWGGAARKPIMLPVAVDPTEPKEPWGAPVNLLDLPSPKLIIRLVALKHGVPSSHLTGPARTRDLVAARDQAIGMIWTHCRQMSLPALGRFFERDHTTILHSLRKLRLHGQAYYRRVGSGEGSRVIPITHRGRQKTRLQSLRPEANQPKSNLSETHSTRDIH